MSAITVGNIRLAAGDNRESVFYNAYHLLTQISALYAHCSLSATNAEHRGILLTFGEALVQDLGDYYVGWESIDKQAPGSAELASVNRLVVHTCSQYGKILQHVNEWTPYARVTTLLTLVENRWRRILQLLQAGAGKELSLLALLQTRGEERTLKLGQEAHKSRLASRITQGAFDVAEQEFLDKSFGF